MDFAESVLIIVNLLAGFGCAIPIARLVGKVNQEPTRAFRYFVFVIGIYFVECVALVMGMGIPVLSVGLAFVWGVVFGLRLKARAPNNEVLRTSFFLSFYSSLPVASFLLIPVLVGLGGKNISSVKEAIRFGIPEFLNPLWPLNTILGFYLIVMLTGIVFKVVITMGEVSLLIHFGKKPQSGGFPSSVRTQS